MVVVQTVAARMAIEDGGPPDRLDRRLAAVESTARDALADMRRLLGLLQIPDQSDAGAVPAVGLAQLPALVDQLRDAGQSVEHEVEASLELPAGLDAAAYRIVQEALTNVIKHARGAQVRVGVRRAGADLVITVANTSPTAVVPQLSGAGRGLIGMRQRATLYGGELEAGPYDGGFRVQARIPLTADDDRPRAFALRARRRNS